MRFSPGRTATSLPASIPQPGPATVPTADSRQRRRAEDVAQRGMSAEISGLGLGPVLVVDGLVEMAASTAHVGVVRRPHP